VPNARRATSWAKTTRRSGADATSAEQADSRNPGGRGVRRAAKPVRQPVLAQGRHARETQGRFARRSRGRVRASAVAQVRARPRSEEAAAGRAAGKGPRVLVRSASVSCGRTAAVRERGLKDCGRSVHRHTTQTGLPGDYPPALYISLTTERNEP